MTSLTTGDVDAVVLGQQNVVNKLVISATIEILVVLKANLHLHIQHKFSQTLKFFSFSLH